MSDHAMTAMPSPDLAIGAFTANGPWVVHPDAMAWRAGIDPLRARTQDRVPGLIRHRRYPPARGALVSWTLVRAVLPLALRYRKRIGTPQAQAELAARVRRAFEQLGPTFIKLGQVIAAAEGMLPIEFVQEFKRCRDRVAPETFEHVRAVIESELGRPLESIFAEFDPTPIAAASIAQVHVARLHGGDEVVVKVQRPDVKRIVTSDIASMAWAAPIIDKRLARARLANLPAYVELFAETIVEELDFRLEAENMLDIAKVLAVTGHRAVIVPRPHPEFVTERVLVMERMHGFNVEDDAGIVDAGVDPSPVFRALMVSFIEGAMIHGVFHGDLHGGNMIVTPDGRAGIFDFGITGRFTEQRRKALLGIMMSSVTQDVRAQLGFFRDLGGFPADSDLDQIAVDLDIDQLTPTAQAEMTPDQLAVQMQGLMTQLIAHGGRMPKELFLYLKGLVYLNGAIASLAPDVDIFAEMSHVLGAFTSMHGDRLAEEIGLDLKANPFDPDSVGNLMRLQLGTDSESLSYRELQEIQTKRMQELREARKKL